jgi:hypothetical protein
MPSSSSRSMRFKDGSATQILVGLNRVGIVGLRDALQKVADAGVRDREAVVGLMLETLRSQNYIAEQKLEAYRIALWREYLRHRGLDFSAFYSEIPITVRGAAGSERDRFVAVVEAVLARLELRPLVTFTDEGPGQPQPELLIRGEPVAKSSQDSKRLEMAIRRAVSHW